VGRVTETATAAVTPLPDRVPARTIRLIRRLHKLDQEGFAAGFGVSTRTVIRWEQNGLDPAQLPTSAEIDGPDWRKRLLAWYLQRYHAALSADSPELRALEASETEKTARGRRARRPQRRA